MMSTPPATIADATPVRCRWPHDTEMAGDERCWRYAADIAPLFLLATTRPACHQHDARPMRRKYATRAMLVMLGRAP